MLQKLLQIYDQSQVNPGNPRCTFAPTLIFNEGWLLRAVLAEWQGQAGSRHGFLPFPPAVQVYSEAQLLTPFKARFKGDKQAEGHTHADGVVGDFTLAGASSAVVLKPDGQYLAVFEAKMFSPLSKGTQNVPHYDQVSRTAACLVHALLRAGPPDRWAAHLVVLYPQDNARIQPGCYTGEHVETQIAARVRGYLAAPGRDEPTARFFTAWRDVLPQIQIQFLTWEDVVAEIGHDDLDRFYALCKRFNQPQEGAAHE